MSSAAALRPAPRPTERRRHRRVPLALLGRYMLPSHEEYPCQTVDVSPGGLLLTAPVKGAVGERVVLYFEHLGRLEGEIARHTGEGFAVALGATVKRDVRQARVNACLAERASAALIDRESPDGRALDLHLDGRHRRRRDV